jgi:hypothetical protein
MKHKSPLLAESQADTDSDLFQFEMQGVLGWKNGGLRDGNDLITFAKGELNLIKSDLKTAGSRHIET